MHRRQFLAGMMATGLLGPLAVRGESAKPASSMTLGFSTYGMKTLTTEQAIDQIAAIGFDAVEITVNADWDADSARFGSARREAVRKQIEARGLTLSSLMENLHIDVDQAARKQRLERVKLAAGLAHDLSPVKPPIMQTVIGGGGTWEEKRQLYADELGEWLGVANADVLTIAIKPHRGGALSKPEEAVELIEMLGKPERLRICYDYAHYDLREMPLEETVRTAMPWVAHIAVKDVVPQGKGTRFVLPGEGGRIDYPRMLQLFQELGYHGDVCSEISGQVWSKPDYDPLAAAKISYANMSAAFDKAGISRPQRSRKV